MKNLIAFIVLFFVAGSLVNAQEVNASFKVSGNCNMCKENIESASMVNGVKSSTWSKKTHMITVNYDESIVKLEDIHASIAKKGYDTDKVRADDKTYSKLPKCCRYDRDKKEKLKN